MIDTHAHFKPDDNWVQILSAMDAAGIQRVIAVGGGPSLDPGALAFAAHAPERVPLALGLDRDEALEGSLDDKFVVLKELLTQHKVCALGEMGLDFHYHGAETADRQYELLVRQFALANELNLPVIIHMREADELMMRALDEVPVRGVVHSFTENCVIAKQVLDRGLYLGFSGIVTFRSADMLRETAAYTPADRLLLETDSPYLAPVPMRGEKNQPAFVRHVAGCVAKVRGVSMEELERVTDANAMRLFNIGVV